MTKAVVFAHITVMLMPIMKGIKSKMSLYTLHDVLITSTHGLVTQISYKRLNVTHQRSRGCAAHTQSD